MSPLSGRPEASGRDVSSERLRRLGVVNAPEKRRDVAAVQRGKRGQVAVLQIRKAATGHRTPKMRSPHPGLNAEEADVVQDLGAGVFLGIYDYETRPCFRCISVQTSPRGVEYVSSPSQRCSYMPSQTRYPNNKDRNGIGCASLIAFFSLVIAAVLHVLIWFPVWLPPNRGGFDGLGIFFFWFVYAVAASGVSAILGLVSIVSAIWARQKNPLTVALIPIAIAFLLWPIVCFGLLTLLRR